MSEPIINSLRKHNLHKQSEVLIAAERTRKLTAFRISREEEVVDPTFPDPRNPDALIQNYINGLDAIMQAKHPEALQRKLAKLKDMLHTQYVISPDPANFVSYFATQAQQARDHKMPYTEPTDAERTQRIQRFIDKQRYSLDVWIDHLATSHYSPEKKYIALSNVVKMGVYNPDKHTYSRRFKKTYKPFPDLNSEALSYTLTKIANGEAENFSDTYGEALHKVDTPFG